VVFLWKETCNLRHPMHHRHPVGKQLQSSYMHHAITLSAENAMGWLRFVGALKLQVSFAKEPYKRDDIQQKRPIILRSLLLVATPYTPKIYQIKKLGFLGILRYKLN